MKHILMALVFVMMVLPAFAAVVQGDKIPHTLETIDQNEEVQSFETVKGEKGAVLFFVRSVDWCPYCQVQLLDLRGEMGESIEAAGYRIVTVSYDAPEKLKAFSSRYNFPFAMLSDPKSEIIKAFGILNEEKKSTQFYGIPHPHVYIVNADGVVRTVLSEEGHKKRPAPEQVLKIVSKVP